MGTKLIGERDTMCKALAVLALCVAVSIAFETEDSVTPLEDMNSELFLQEGKGGAGTAKTAEKTAAKAENKAEAVTEQAKKQKDKLESAKKAEKEKEKTVKQAEEKVKNQAKMLKSEGKAAKQAAKVTTLTPS